jgi:hypothetical protein
MKIDNTSSSTQCDCCLVIIPDRQFYRNDGSYQSDTIKFKGLDLCNTCAARVLEKYQDQMDIDIESLKERYAPMGRARIKLDLFNIFKGDTNEN